MKSDWRILSPKEIDSFRVKFGFTDPFWQLRLAQLLAIRETRVKEAFDTKKVPRLWKNYVYLRFAKSKKAIGFLEAMINYHSQDLDSKEIEELQKAFMTIEKYLKQ